MTPTDVLMKLFDIVVLFLSFTAGGTRQRATTERAPGSRSVSRRPVEEVHAVERSLPVYVLITPARNEAQFIKETLESVVKQTHRPLRWIVVSDGSTDGTDEIVSTYEVQHDWIELVRRPDRAQRNFAGKVDAFNAGYARLAGMQYDVIGNLDGDISFDEDYLEFIVGKFAENPKLGVAGTPYREHDPRHDERFKNPDHVSGACQLFRRACFEDIQGYRPVRSGGIDLIALLSAQAKGWQTKRFDEKVCLHRRSSGGGQHPNIYARLFNRGTKDYLLGSHPVFETFRSAHQMRSRPYVLGGALMFAGYMWAMLRGLERSMPQKLIALRQLDQMQRLRNFLRRPLRRGTSSKGAARS